MSSAPGRRKPFHFFRKENCFPRESEPHREPHPPFPLARYFYFLRESWEREPDRAKDKKKETNVMRKWINTGGSGIQKNLPWSILHFFFFFLLLLARSFDATFASATWLGGNGTQTHVRVELSELASTKHLNNYSKTSHMFLSFKLIDHCPAPWLFH